MNSTVLKLSSLVRTYQAGGKSLAVLRGIDLVVRPGEIVGLIGPSGSGKSSLLHAAGLLEHPDDGTIEVDGHDYSQADDVTRAEVRRAKLGYVYQFHNLIAELSALENVALPLRIQGEVLGEAQKRASELLCLMGLGDRLDHRPAQLSGGEQQRVAIARGLANRPRLLIADEPTGNLDPTTSDQVFAHLSHLTREQGAAALIATHNLELTRHMDRVFALVEGRLVQKAA